ncbi:hypothetical protein [Microbacterium sp. CIAB417]|uniref:hypothetical protein n=1 Tax=Microbacterium sp. CIAB417 TaxID=2860287 RepID=UPI001FAC4E9B|nr:hypothetical protein [Microbacterium sp. CIAB417]
MNTDRKLRTRLLSAVPIAALAFSLAACGAPAAERPSTEELSEGITTILEDQGLTVGDGEDAQLTPDQVDCISGELLDSEISDQDLANLAEGKDEQTSQDAFNLVQTTMTEAVQTCAAPAE